MMSKTLSANIEILQEEHLKSVDRANDETRELVKHLVSLSAVLIPLTILLLSSEIFNKTSSEFDRFLAGLMIVAFTIALFSSVIQLYINYGFWNKYAKKLLRGMEKLDEYEESKGDEFDYIKNTFSEIFAKDEEKTTGIPLFVAYGGLIIGSLLLVLLIFSAFVFIDKDNLNEDTIKNYKLYVELQVS